MRVRTGVKVVHENFAIKLLTAFLFLHGFLHTFASGNVLNVVSEPLVSARLDVTAGDDYFGYDFFISFVVIKISTVVSRGEKRYVVIYVR